MNDIDITLYLNEYRVRALAYALGSQTAETVEDKLTEAFDTLFIRNMFPMNSVPPSRQGLKERTPQSRRGWKRPDALRFITSVKTVKTGISQATTSSLRCRQLTATVCMTVVSCPQPPKPSPTLLLK